MVFPEGFLWGVAVASFQVEMGRGTNADSSDWWVWLHDAENRRRGWVSGDVPEEGPGFWELYEQDLSLAYKLGCNAFRLSLDWARIFPKSTRNVSVEIHRDRFGNVERIYIDEEAVKALGRLSDKESMKRYRVILGECRRLGMEPMVTLYHWPIPSWLHDPVGVRDGTAPEELRGWLNEGTIIEFAKYCAYVAHVLGGQVDLWGTINEVKIVADHGFLDGGEFPPGLNDFGLFMRAMRHLSMAHGVAYDQVRRWDLSQAGPFGPSRIGIIAVLHYHEPADPSSEADVQATLFNDYLFNEWSLNAIFRGDYDMDVDGVVDGEEQLPHLARGCDWIGINYYMRRRVRHKVKGGIPYLDFEFMPANDPSDIGFDTYPEGLRFVCDWAYNRYRRPIFVTENGIADSTDTKRGKYIENHIRELQKTVELDGVPVPGYFHWSLIDNLEWASGYNVKFGLFSVDTLSKRRISKASAEVFRRIAERNGVS